MKRIILLLNAANYKAEILDFATAIAKPGNSKIVGVFLDHHHLDTEPSIKKLGGQVYVEEITEDPTERKRKKDLTQRNIELFMDGCAQREVCSLVHQGNENMMERIIDETRYADLVIADPSTSFSREKKVPSKFVLELLSRSECPVLLAPEYFEQPSEVVFAYDGSRSSVYAIKQFYYLLPYFADKKTTILHVSEHGEPLNVNERERNLLNEWLDKKFPESSFVTLNGDADDVLLKHFLAQETQFDKILVTGAYGRNLLSTLFKPSTADLLLKAVDVPMFITHH